MEHILDAFNSWSNKSADDRHALLGRAIHRLDLRAGSWTNLHSRASWLTAIQLGAITALAGVIITTHLYTLGIAILPLLIAVDEHLLMARPRRTLLIREPSAPSVETFLKSQDPAYDHFVDTCRRDDELEAELLTQRRRQNRSIRLTRLTTPVAIICLVTSHWTDPWLTSLYEWFVH